MTFQTVPRMWAVSGLAAALAFAAACGGSGKKDSTEPGGTHTTGEGGEGGAVCPTCTEADDPSERQKQEKAETVRQVVAAGETFELEWDGQVLAYEKAPKEVRGKNKKCECWKKAPAPPAEYTVRACALRQTVAVGKTSKMECVEAVVTLPVLEGTSTDIVLTFADQPPAKPGKGKK